MAACGRVYQAMILAAGEGTRMRPLTLDSPKVLLPIDGGPLMGYTISWLKDHGITDIIVNLHYLGGKIKDFLGDGSRFGVRISYSVEETLLGTAGGVKRAEGFFDGTFVVVYGDVLTDFDLRKMIRFHRARKALATLAVLRTTATGDVGIVALDGGGKITGFVEKPLGVARKNLVNGGVYVLESDVLKYIAEGFSDFAYHVFPLLLALNLPVYGYVLKPDDYLLDIGTPERYRQTGEDMKAGRVKLRYGEQSGLSG
jgi:NDP-sugar pyrophosphorylase family protein